MTERDADRTVRKRIEALVGEEHRLRAQKGISGSDEKRLEAIGVELDRCWTSDLAPSGPASVRPLLGLRGDDLRLMSDLCTVGSV